MATLKQNQANWLSLVLLLVCYTWFGWYLCSLKPPPWVEAACFQIVGAPLPPELKEFGALSPAPPPEDPAVPSESKSAPAEVERSPELTPAAPAEVEKTTQPEKKIVPTAHNKPQKLTHHSNNGGAAICETIIQYNLPAGILAIGWIFLSSMAFISPLTSFSSFISRWFRSDTVAFTTIFLLASLAAVILYWLHIFLQILTILAVDILARIDIQYAGLTGVQAFWILTVISFTGLVLGWTANALI